MGWNLFQQWTDATFLAPLAGYLHPPLYEYARSSVGYNQPQIHKIVHLFNTFFPTNMQRRAFASRTIFRFEAEPRFPEIAQNTSALPRTSTTPSPSPSSILSAKESPTSNSSSSIFFRRLPLEIQQSILTFAFGNRIIHLELNAEDSQWRLRGFVCARSPTLATEHQGVAAVNDLCLHHLALIQSAAKPPSNFQDPEKGYQIGAMGWLLSSKQA